MKIKPYYLIIDLFNKVIRLKCRNKVFSTKVSCIKIRFFIFCLIENIIFIKQLNSLAPSGDLGNLKL